MKNFFVKRGRLPIPTTLQLTLFGIAFLCTTLLVIQIDAKQTNIEYFYVNAEGRKVLKGAGYYGNSFSEGMALSCDEYRVDQRSLDFRYRDKSGKECFKIRAMEAHPFSDGRALIRVESSNSHTGLVGFVDRQGRWVIPPKYRTGRSFSEGRALVVTEDGYPQYIDTSGQVALQLNGYEGVMPTFSIHQFDFGAYSQGLSSFQIGRGSWYIDKDGKQALGRTWTGMDVQLEPFCEGVAVVLDRNNKLSFVKSNGEIISDTGFKSARAFSEGLVAVRVKSQWGFADKNFRLAIAPKFQDASDFSNGLARVTLLGKEGFINRRGEFVIPPQYAFCGDFSDGVALVVPFLKSPKKDRFDKPELVLWGRPSGKNFFRLTNTKWDLLPLND